MVELPGGAFLMGSDSSDAIVNDGEGPVREILIDGFFLSRYPVTNERFARFIRATGYKTEAEKIGSSFVFRNHLKKRQVKPAIPAAPWWVEVRGASWAHPVGPASSLRGKERVPVVHVTWNDMMAYCAWAGVRPVTEAEWEYAARGGKSQMTYPWGNELTPGATHMCNIWQGEFPSTDLAEDGYDSPAPVDEFEPNGFGLYNMVGNTWEWVNDWFDVSWHIDAAPSNPVGPPVGEAKVMRGGSYLCHKSYCFRYRNSSRTGNWPGTISDNLGFRVARDT